MTMIAVPNLAPSISFTQAHIPETMLPKPPEPLVPWASSTPAPAAVVCVPCSSSVGEEWMGLTSGMFEGTGRKSGYTRL